MNAHPSQGRSTQQRSTSRMKTARKLSSSLRSVWRSISKKFTPSKPQQQAQVICPVDAYPGKQIAIQTPDGQTLNVIVPRNVMPGMPFNLSIARRGQCLLFIGVSNMNIICGFSSAYLHSVSEPTGAKHVKTDGKAQQYSETLHFAYVCLDQDTSVKNKIKHT